MIAYLFVFAVIFAIAFYAYPNIRKKLIIYYHALLFWWYCQELVETPPPKKTYPHTRMQSKTVLFIRHGESEWNSIVNEFNIADIMWWYRLLRIGVFEMVYFITRPNSSKLIDSPLNQKGLQQAIAASEPFNAYFSSQGFSKRRCCFISSQLRRAIETAAYVCDSHLSTSNPLRVRSELQELSPNIDAYSLLDNKKGAPCTELTFTRVSCQKVLDIGDFEGNAGNKRASELGEVRIDRFATWLAMDPHHDVYIVVGHSLWMKRFFNRYVPTTDCGQVRYCNEKIKNCGIVAFEFAMNSENKPLVVPSTIVAVN